MPPLHFKISNTISRTHELTKFTQQFPDLGFITPTLLVKKVRSRELVVYPESHSQEAVERGLSS